jgi:hypothetical protein
MGMRMLVRGMYVERLLFSRPPKEIPVRTTHQEKNKESVMTYINYVPVVYLQSTSLPNHHHIKHVKMYVIKNKT